MCDSVLSPVRLTFFNNLALPLLMCPCLLGFNNTVRRLLAWGDKMAITSRKRMSLTGDNGLGIVEALVKQTNLFFNNLVGSV